MKDSGDSVPAAARRPEPTQRQFYVKRHRIIGDSGFGYTGGCAGRDAIRNGKGSIPHNAACRRRIQEELSKTTSGKRKVDAHEAKMAKAVAEHIEKPMRVEEETVDKKRKSSESQSQPLAVKARVGENGVSGASSSSSVQDSSMGANPTNVSAGSVPSSAPTVSVSSGPSASQDSSSAGQPPVAMDTSDDNVHERPELSADDRMILEVSNSLDDASSVELEQLLQLYKEFGAVSYDATVSEFIPRQGFQHWLDTWVFDVGSL